MSEKAEQIECKKIGCRLKGFWYEETPDGRMILCLPLRHDGRRHIRKFKLPKGVKQLELA